MARAYRANAHAWVTGVRRTCADSSTGAGAASAGEAPADPLRAVQADAVGECLADVELPARHVRAAVDHLRQHLLAAEGEIELHAAREHGMRDALRTRGERLSAGG